MNRQPYWLTALTVGGLILLGSLLVYAIPLVGTVVGVGVWLAAAALGLGAAVKRLHDRGKSAWWLLPMYVPLLLISMLGALVESASGEANPVLSMLSLPFSIWIFVDLGCLRGTVGPNRFGPDPLMPELQEVFG